MHECRPATRWLTFLGMISIFICSSGAITLGDLRNDSNLTPQHFASFFSNFRYEYRAAVQPPEIFLATQSGDCDDYATLADMVLREKGYTTRLVTVRTKHVVHVVCYVKETQTYLDFNNRGCFRRTIHCGEELPAIASAVAKSLHEDWNSVTEFKFDAGLKRLVKTVLRPEFERDQRLTASKTLPKSGLALASQSESMPRN